MTVIDKVTGNTLTSDDELITAAWADDPNRFALAPKAKEPEASEPKAKAAKG